MRRMFLIITMTAACATNMSAQYYWNDTDDTSRPDLTKGLGYKVEMQASVSKGQTPLWLNANKHGLSSLDKTNGYVRAAVERPLATDSARRWAFAYGLDLVAPLHYTSKVVVQQAYAEVRWLHGTLTAGSKQYPMELKNQSLSSGSQTLGINARPVPQVRLALPEYWTLPLLNGWVQLKGHIAYGMMTDGSWQEEFTSRVSKYTGRVLYHSKAGYLKIGNEDAFFPLSIEMGLEMAAQFGGNLYRPDNHGNMIKTPTTHGIKDFWHAFVPGGADATDGEYANVAGNQLGSWVFRINYDADRWRLSLYGDHFFEDHSQMFLLDYDGYGSGDEWMVKKDRRFHLYKLKDIMLGTELHMKYGSWLRNVVVEYVYTKYQSGPYNHDHTINIPDHVAGVDDYYNHGNYAGWQHWGQVIGNPLYRSPIYNTDGKLEVKDNRFSAWHLGISGQPSSRFDYRALATYQTGWGTYNRPFTKPHHNVSFMVEGNYHFRHGWKATAAYGMDFGSTRMLGHNAGMQLTVSKTGVFK